MAIRLLGQTGANSGAPRPDPIGIAFGSFYLDLTGCRLLQGTRAIPLRPKTWAVLRYLVERPSMLVTKDELFDALWPDVAVTPDTLNKSISELRAAFEDDSQAPRFIETAHRLGFRFIAEARPVAAADQVPVGVSPFSRPEPRRGSFVGREKELELLAQRFVKAQAGERQVVFVTGPAGVGKTALVDAFLGSRAVCETRAPVWVGSAGCFEHHGPQEAYLPVFEALERLARPPNVERVVSLLRRAAPMWLAQMPWLVSESDAAALRHALQGVRPERMPRELAALIEALTTDLTLVLVLEDLHWSDPSTVDLLTLLAQRRDPARLLVIGTYRPADLAVREHVLANAVRTLHVQGQCGELPLHDLSEEAVRAYLAIRFPGNDFPLSLAHQIYEHTGGQPLFLVAIVDHLLSRGWILDTAPGWALSARPETMDLGVPDDVRRMIETQFHRLNPAERSLLEAASVAGNEIASPIIAAALGCEAGVAELHCETLARAQQFLHVAGKIEWPAGGVARHYVFTHELYRQVVYEEIPEGRCARLHQRTGEALEAAYGARATEIAPQLAAHFQRGRDAARAVRYLISAGVRARQRFASREAIGYLEPALALVALLPDADERGRCELAVRLALGRALGDVSGFGAEPVRANYERAYELCVALEKREELFEALYARWYVHALRAERDETIARAAELDDLARRLGTAGHGVLADSALVRTAFYSGRFTDAVRPMESLQARRAAWQDAAELVGYGVDPVIAATVHYAGVLWFLGDPEGARATAHTGLASAQESLNPFFLAAALGQTALVELLCGNSAAGGALAAEAASLAAAQGFALWNGFALGMQGWARVQQGQLSAGSRDITRALAALQATGMQLILPYLYAFLAEAHLRAQAPAAGLAAADAGLALAATTLDRGYEPELWRLKGELLLASSVAEHPRPQRGKRAGKPAVVPEASAWPEAERCLLRALELSRTAQAKSLELRAATSLARAWQARGRIGEARAVLREICDWFDAGLSSADLLEARGLLGKLAQARVPDARPAGSR